MKKVIRFFMKCVVLITILFIGVLIGMQKANEGMLKMKGYEDHTLSSPFTINEINDEHVEATILGKNIAVQEYQDDQKEPKDHKVNNFFFGVRKIDFSNYHDTNRKIIFPFFFLFQ